MIYQKKKIQKIVLNMTECNSIKIEKLSLWKGGLGL